jgi:hypothetical protein
MAERPPLRNRGAGAWDYVAQGRAPSVHVRVPHPAVDPVVTRAQVHAITDDSNGKYLRVIDEALAALQIGIHQRRWPEPRTLVDLDRCLAQVVDDWIYIDGYHSSKGRTLQAAWRHVYNHELPSTERAITGWLRLGQEGEGHGICEERWAAILRKLFEDVGTQEAAIWWALGKDVYARGEQDLKGLRVTPADVSFVDLPGGGVEVAVFFGLRARGESVKTGSDQGAIVDAPWLAQLLRSFFESRPANGPLFSISAQRVRQAVILACEALGIPVPSGGLHVLRHTGAATDVYAERRKLDQVQRRGRWVSPSSVQRYTKTVHLVSDRAQLPPAVAEYGRAFLYNPAAYATVPLARRVAFGP